MINFDNLFGWLFCWQTGFLVLVIYSLVLLVRRVTENAYKPIRVNPWWTNVVLPLLPLTLGFILCLLVATAPYPDGISSRWAHALYGLVCGAFSSKGYRILNSMIRKQFPDMPIGELEQLDVIATPVVSKPDDNSIGKDT